MRVQGLCEGSGFGFGFRVRFELGFVLGFVLGFRVWVRVKVCGLDGVRVGCQGVALGSGQVLGLALV